MLSVSLLEAMLWGFEEQVSDGDKDKSHENGSSCPVMSANPFLTIIFFSQD